MLAQFFGIRQLPYTTCAVFAQLALMTEMGAMEISVANEEIRLLLCNEVGCPGMEIL